VYTDYIGPDYAKVREEERADTAFAERAAEADFARVTINGEAAYLARLRQVRLGQAVVSLPPGAFLQATPGAQAAMSDFLAAQAAGATRIADLNCSVGTFTFRLAEIAQVYAVDFAPEAIHALAAALGLLGITAEARDLVRRPVLVEELKKTDLAAFDSPRAGAAEQTAELARSSLGRVIAVSCSPATFARAARTLIDAGFSLDRVLPVDQFLWSPHIELVGVFSR
jgi:23S rRNA (uracil1939-C5)-methyltransferase